MMYPPATGSALRQPSAAQLVGSHVSAPVTVQTQSGVHGIVQRQQSHINWQQHQQQLQQQPQPVQSQTRGPMPQQRGALHAPVAMSGSLHAPVTMSGALHAPMAARSEWEHVQPVMSQARGPMVQQLGSLRVPVTAPSEWEPPRKSLPPPQQQRHLQPLQLERISQAPSPVPSDCGPMAQEGRQSAANANSADAEFLRLLDSLEVRVDLMAQMQHTRNQIQAQSRAGLGPSTRSAGAEADHGPEVQHALLSQLDQMKQHLGRLGGVPAGVPQAQAGLAAGGGGGARGSSGAGAMAEAPSNQGISTQPDAEEARRPEELAQENEELWAQLAEQGAVIRKLASEVERLQTLLKDAFRPDADNLEVRSLQHQLHEERRLREAQAEAFQSERDRLLEEMRALRGLPVTAGGLTTQSPTQPPGQRTPDAPNYSKSPADSPLSPASSGTAGGAFKSPGGMDEAVLPTRVLQAAQAAAAEGLGSSLPAKPAEAEFGYTAPFSSAACGSNVTLSEDGYVAARTRGCRQSVLIGSSPLEKRDIGWYYELEVRETVEGWVGGLGLGITKTGPLEIRRVPDKAWRMPSTFMVGYWGCVFLDGKERRTAWRPDTLPTGARVGMLATSDGDLRVFVDGVSVVCIQGALKDILEPGLELYPILDVFAATVAVQLQPYAKVPDPPWADDPTTPPAALDA
eukprot:TRINITY_DN58011_c0_g1_i1.p1 TRINITY_DN58011_c0_g1~~TRINITY_DN58011_c0_g1_i1.p1  ORF type:complete len:692 (+),score=142.10 TRINITY_DN58011_c0_g1_i1:25-2076(+)